MAIFQFPLDWSNFLNVWVYHFCQILKKKDNYVIPFFQLRVYSLNPRHGLSCVRLWLCVAFFPLAYFILGLQVCCHWSHVLCFSSAIKVWFGYFKTLPSSFIHMNTVNGAMVPSLMAMITHFYAFFSPWSIVFDGRFFAMRCFPLCLSSISPSSSCSGGLEPRAYTCEVSSIHWAKALALFRNFSCKPNIAISPLLVVNIFILRYIFLCAWDEVND